MDDFTRPRASTSVALDLRLSYLSEQRVSARGDYVTIQLLEEYYFMYQPNECMIYLLYIEWILVMEFSFR